MSQVFIPYEDAAGTKWAAQQDLSAEGLLNDYVAVAAITARVAPFGNAYATLAALQAFTGWSGAELIPTGINTRKLSLSLFDSKTTAPGSATDGAIAAATVVVGDAATYDLLFPTGATPFPEAGLVMTALGAAITAAQGESRTGN